MSNSFVVCQSAEDAAAVCLALKQKGTDAKIYNEKEGNKESKNRSQSKGNYDREGKKGKKRIHKKPYERAKRLNPNFKAAKIDAPVLSDIMIVGDSIALRLARQQQVYAPKYMKLCHGGATLQSLHNSLNEYDKAIHKSVCLIAGTNNILKDIPVNDELLESMIEALKSKGAEKIYILTLPPMCKENKSHQTAKNINAIILNQNKPENNVFVINISATFLNEDESTNFALFEKFYYNGRQDLIHPNAQGLQLVADQILEFINTQMA